MKVVTARKHTLDQDRGLRKSWPSYRVVSSLLSSKSKYALNHEGVLQLNTMNHFLVIIKISEHSADPESVGELLITAGAGSVEVSVDDLSLRVIIPETEESAVMAVIERLGATIVSREPIVERNWAVLCPELLRPIEAGKFSIRPCASASETIPEEGVIHVIPGMGFGTGHHDTTHALLGMISEISERSKSGTWGNSTLTIVDVGTGSGILAIAAAMAFPEAAIFATDIDDAALANATENCALNGVTERVSLLHTSLPVLSAPAEVVIANLYAELLVSLRDDLFSLLAPGGTLLISGIAAHQDDEVAAAFAELPISLEYRWESPTHSDPAESRMRWVARNYRQLSE
jgi:ribosomal protein L11 methyltransferase